MGGEEAMSEKVQGYCPFCGGETLFLGSGGYVTCSTSDCQNPSGVSDILDDSEREHIVTVFDTYFTIRHPLRERLGDGMLACGVGPYMSGITEPVLTPPIQPGTYRVWWRAEGGPRWESIK